MVHEESVECPCRLCGKGGRWDTVDVVLLVGVSIRGTGVHGQGKQGLGRQTEAPYRLADLLWSTTYTPSVFLFFQPVLPGLTRATLRYHATL